MRTIRGFLTIITLVIITFMFTGCAGLQGLLPTLVPTVDQPQDAPTPLGLNVRGNQNFTGRVNMGGTFRLKSVDVDATAAELNTMDGITATTAEINATEGRLDALDTSGTNVAAELIVETNRAQVAELANAAALVVETNRAQVAEALLASDADLITETNRAQVAEALLASDADLVTETNRAQVAEALLSTIVSWNQIRNYLADGLLIHGTLVISAGNADEFKTTTTAVYTLAGVTYTKAATDGLVFTLADTINTGGAATAYWGIWLVQINAAGTVSTKAGGGSADQLYTSGALAIAALPAVDASNASLGYILVASPVSTPFVCNTTVLTGIDTYSNTQIKALPAAL